MTLNRLWVEPVHCAHCMKYIEPNSVIYTRIKGMHSLADNLELADVEYESFHESCARQLGIFPPRR